MLFSFVSDQLRFNAQCHHTLQELPLNSVSGLPLEYFSDGRG